MVMASKNNVRFDLDDESWKLWHKILDDRKITGVNAFRCIMRWLPTIPVAAQNVVLGQSEPRSPLGVISP